MAWRGCKRARTALPSKLMRVIAGQFRSRVLTAPRGLDTRPTGDKLRETLFNVLAPQMAGAVFADFYAGSGANGIEALSRGARLAVFVENAAPALAALRANLHALPLSSGFIIEPRSVAAALKRLKGQVFDVVFLDPPYRLLEEYARTLGSLGSECAPLLAPDAIVVAEHHRKQSLDDSYGLLRRYRLLEQGDAALSFYRAEHVGNCRGIDL